MRVRVDWRQVFYKLDIYGFEVKPELPTVKSKIGVWISLVVIFLSLTTIVASITNFLAETPTLQETQIVLNDALAVPTFPYIEALMLLNSNTPYYDPSYITLSLFALSGTGKNATETIINTTSCSSIAVASNTPSHNRGPANQCWDLRTEKKKFRSTENAQTDNFLGLKLQMNLCSNNATDDSCALNDADLSAWYKKQAFQLRLWIPESDFGTAKEKTFSYTVTGLFVQLHSLHYRFKRSIVAARVFFGNEVTTNYLYNTKEEITAMAPSSTKLPLSAITIGLDDYMSSVAVNYSTVSDLIGTIQATIAAFSLMFAWLSSCVAAKRFHNAAGDVDTFTLRPEMFNAYGDYIGKNFGPKRDSTAPGYSKQSDLEGRGVELAPVEV